MRHMLERGLHTASVEKGVGARVVQRAPKEGAAVQGAVQVLIYPLRNPN